MMLLRNFFALTALALLARWVSGEDQPMPKAFFEKHCVRCHGADKQEADLRIDTLGRKLAVSRSADAWVEVLDRINLGEMPPQDEPRPTAKELEAAVDWITAQLEGLRHQTVSTGGRVLLRRLTRTEYLNTIRDLLGVEFVASDGPMGLLPPDGSIDGFTKVSKGLLLDPSLMEKYLAAAEVAANRAVRVRQPLVPTRTMRFEFEQTARATGIGYQVQRRSMGITEDGVMVYHGSARTGYELKHPFDGTAVPITSRYIVRVRAAAAPGFRKRPIYMDLSFGQQGRLQRFRVDAPLDQPQVYQFEGTLDGTIGAELSIGMVNGISYFEHNLLSSLDNVNELANDPSRQRDFLRTLARYQAEGYDLYSNRPNYDCLDLEESPRLYLDYVELEGPINGPWPPHSMSIVFPGYPQSLAKDNQTIDYARQVFERLLPRAYRRPVTDDELDRIVDLVAGELEIGKPFHEAIRVGIVGMLCAPQFLYLFEPDHPGTTQEHAEEDLGIPGSRRLNSFELATRLSYFLWSSKPDERLFHLARRDQIVSSRALAAEVDRMLSDEKSEALVNDFARQWLRIDEFDRFAPDQLIYPEFYNAENAGVGVDMKAEPLAMFREILRNDESVLNLLDSDWTMLNERLARYYGIEGVVGPEFRRVSLPAESSRGGLLGMAGFHKWGSDGSRTKPVERGKYILDVLFNDSPPPPPPNAGEVQPNTDGQHLTIRQRLEQHRTVATCANCHRRIDPYGLALENFNAIGQWRTKQDGEQPLAYLGARRRTLEINGTLPNGAKYNNYSDFKKAISAQSDRFTRGLAEKMLVYALGRSLELSDRPALEKIVQAAKTNRRSLRSMIKAIVATQQFQTK